MEKMISAKRLLEWLENNDEAKGFWGKGEPLEAYDNLTDAINQGKLDASQ